MTAALAPPASRFGRYELLERIGEGGMAEVFRARLPGPYGFEKVVVIKRILPHLAESEDFLRMFADEARIAAGLQHQNIVQVFELAETDEGEPYMVLEHVHGVDLRALLVLAESAGLRVPVWFAAHVGAAILGALAHAHELLDPEGRALGVVHRDVTPSNVFLSFNGEVKLADFGVAKALGTQGSSAESTRSSALRGKLAYASPEQLLGHPVDARADLFAVGAVLWELLTQQRLFEGRADFETMLAICEGVRPRPSLKNLAVPPALDALVLRALETSPAHRFSSAREMQSALLSILAELRPRLLPSDVKHTVEVLTGRRAPLPGLGADLPVEVPGADSAKTQASLSEPAPRRASPAREEAPLSQYDEPPEDDGIYVEDPVELRLATPPPLDRALERPVTPTAPLMRARTRVSETPAPPPLSPLSGDLPRWEAEAEAAGSGPNFGAHPFYVRTPDGMLRGPLEHRALMRLLESKSVEVVAVSGDAERWIPFERFTALAGLDALSHARPRLENVTLVGNLEEAPVVSVLARLARVAATGRLVLFTGAGTATRRELELVRGGPVHVWTDRPDLQIPALVVRRELLPRERVPELLHTIVSRELPFDEALRATIGGRGRHRAIFMRDRLVELLRWRQGRWAFDAGPLEGAPFARSVIAGLVDLLARAFSEAELASRLAPWLHDTWSATAELGPTRELLEPSHAQSAIVDLLSEGKPIAALVKKWGAGAVLPVALVAIDAGMIRREGSGSGRHPGA